MDAFEHILDKYGPMALALVVISLVLVLFVYKVLPLITGQLSRSLQTATETANQGMRDIANQLHLLIESVKSSLDALEKKISQQDVSALQRHEEMIRRLNRLREEDDKKA